MALWLRLRSARFRFAGKDHCSSATSRGLNCGLALSRQYEKFQAGGVERIAMCQEERDWLDWVKRVRDGVITQRQTAEKIGITDLWVRTLLARMENEGDEVVVLGQAAGVSRQLRVPPAIQSATGQ